MAFSRRQRREQKRQQEREQQERQNRERELQNNQQRENQQEQQEERPKRKRRSLLWFNTGHYNDLLSGDENLEGEEEEIESEMARNNGNRTVRFAEPTAAVAEEEQHVEEPSASASATEKSEGEGKAPEKQEINSESSAEQKKSEGGKKSSEKLEKSESEEKPSKMPEEPKDNGESSATLKEPGSKEESSTLSNKPDSSNDKSATQSDKSKDKEEPAPRIMSLEEAFALRASTMPDEEDPDAITPIPGPPPAVLPPPRYRPSVTPTASAGEENNSSSAAPAPPASSGGSELSILGPSGIHPFDNGVPRVWLDMNIHGRSDLIAWPEYFERMIRRFHHPELPIDPDNLKPEEAEAKDLWKRLRWLEGMKVSSKDIQTLYKSFPFYKLYLLTVLYFITWITGFPQFMIVALIRDSCKTEPQPKWLRFLCGPKACTQPWSRILAAFTMSLGLIFCFFILLTAPEWMYTTIPTMNAHLPSRFQQTFAWADNPSSDKVKRSVGLNDILTTGKYQFIQQSDIFEDHNEMAIFPGNDPYVNIVKRYTPSEEWKQYRSGWDWTVRLQQISEEIYLPRPKRPLYQPQGYAPDTWPSARENIFARAHYPHVIEILGLKGGVLRHHIPKDSEFEMSYVLPEGDHLSSPKLETHQAIYDNHRNMCDAKRAGGGDICTCEEQLPLGLRIAENKTATYDSERYYVTMHLLNPNGRRLVYQFPLAAPYDFDNGYSGFSLDFTMPIPEFAHCELGVKTILRIGKDPSKDVEVTRIWENSLPCHLPDGGMLRGNSNCQCLWSSGTFARRAD